jgi:hypothetical protein
LGAPSLQRDKELLYVSDLATDDVYVYDYASGAAVGKLTGFDQPGAQCVDQIGDIYIATVKGLVRYRHGGKHRMETLPGPAIGCVMHPNTWRILIGSRG